MARKLLYASSASLFVVILAAILVIVYFIASNHNVNWDLSRTGSNTLDARTGNVLRSLDFDVDITVFDKEGEEGRRAREILDLYVTESRRISYTVIDPDARPGVAGKYGVDRYGQAVLVGRQRQTLVDRVTEDSITNALLNLKRDSRKVLYFTTGHGERDISREDNQGFSQLGSALEKDDYEVHALVLMREQAIPQNADLVVVAGPVKSLLPEEQDIIRNYLGRGGRMLIALEPGPEAGLKGLLEEYGIALDAGIIVDRFNTMVGGDYTVPVVTTYGDAPGVKGFAYATLFPTSRSLMIREGLPDDLAVTWLARTSDQSWSESDYATLIDEGTATRDESERKGPLNVALLAEKKISEEIKASLLVFGDTDFCTNAYLNVSGNKDLVLGCIKMLLHAGHKITIDKKSAQDRPFILTPVQNSLMFWIPVIIIPALILCAAVATFRVRRRS